MLRGSFQKATILGTFSMPTTPIKLSKYSRLATELRQQIQAGTLKPGDRLPSFPEMKARHGVSQATLERTHTLLEREGLIVRQQGRGTFVLNAPSAEGAARADGLLQDAIVVLSCTTNPSPTHAPTGFMDDLTYGALQAIRGAGWHAITLHPERFKGQGIDRLIAERPQGVIITDLVGEATQTRAWADALGEKKIPVVVSGGSPDLAGYDRVTSDHATGAYLLAHWLIGQGRRRLLQLWPTPATGYWFAQRQAGYEQALREANLEPLPVVVWPPQPGRSRNAEEFADNVRRMAGFLVEHLTGPRPADAILAGTDIDLFVAAAACRLCGRTPNQDVALVGYDNCWASCDERAFEPTLPLATIDKRNFQMGEQLVKLLLDRVGGRLRSGPQSCVVPPQMILIGAERIFANT